MALLLTCAYLHAAQSLTGRKGPDRSVQVSSFIRPCAEQKHLRPGISPIWYVSLPYPPMPLSGTFCHDFIMPRRPVATGSSSSFSCSYSPAIGSSGIASSGFSPALLYSGTRVRPLRSSINGNMTEKVTSSASTSEAPDRSQETGSPF